jgi:hypothetical protein
MLCAVVLLLLQGSSSVETYSGSQQLQQLSERYDIQQAALDDAEVRSATMRYSMQLADMLRASSGQQHTIIAQVRLDCRSHPPSRLVQQVN